MWNPTREEAAPSPLTPCRGHAQITSCDPASAKASANCAAAVRTSILSCSAAVHESFAPLFLAKIQQYKKKGPRTSYDAEICRIAKVCDRPWNRQSSLVDVSLAIGSFYRIALSSPRRKQMAQHISRGLTKLQIPADVSNPMWRR